MMSPMTARSSPRFALAEREEARARILEAARACFARKGVAKTTMEDVAREAGIGRTILYRFYSGRSELVEAAIVERIRELAAGLADAAARHTTFAEALVEVSLATIETARHDGELHSLFESAGDIRLHQVLAGNYPPTVRLVLDFWRPWFEKARAEGDMRADVRDEDAVEWIRGCYLSMILRDDLTVERERQLLTDFLLPALRPSAAEG
jgi:AcrR family transcriptional regulator